MNELDEFCPQCFVEHYMDSTNLPISEEEIEVVKNKPAEIKFALCEQHQEGNIFQSINWARALIEKK